MNFGEFMNKVVEAFPDAEVGEDNDRQLIIYTNLQVDPDGESAANDAAGGDPDSYRDNYRAVQVIPFEEGQ